MRKYELVLVMRPSLKDAERKKILETIKSWLKDVTIVKEDDWGQKLLAYVIKKETAGHYYQLQLESENGLEKDLGQRILRNENVIRHLLVRTK
jgi:small subunit ribosomal protein S6